MAMREVRPDAGAARNRNAAQRNIAPLRLKLARERASDLPRQGQRGGMSQESRELAGCLPWPLLATTTSSLTSPRL